MAPAPFDIAQALCSTQTGERSSHPVRASAVALLSPIRAVGRRRRAGSTTRPRTSRLDQAGLAAEPQAFEEAVDGDVAVVGLGVDGMEGVLLEQLADRGHERLGRRPVTLMRWCERDPTSAVAG